MTTLRTAALAFVAANIVHSFDHLRQGTGRLSAEIVWAGSALSIAAIVVAVLVLRSDGRAGAVAAGVGLSGALGIAASHLAPHWSALSDPYADVGADALSWIVMLAEVGAALWLAGAGISESRGGTRRAAPPLI